MSNLLSSIPLIGGMFDDSDQQALDQLSKNQGIYQGLQTPNFKNYKPEEYQYSGDYSPELMQASTVQADPSMRLAQSNVLNRMAGLSDVGLSDVDNAGYQNARNIGNSVAQSGNASAMQNAQARGVGGSGLEFAMREAANQGGTQNAQQSALQQAADSARQRALYTQAYGSALNNQRSQDFNQNSYNNNILNQFNQMNTQSQNQAQQRNMDARQGVYNANVGQRNSAQQYNNDIAQRGYQDQYQRASGMAGANSGMAQGYGAENAANTNARNQNTGLAFSAISGGMSGGASGAAPVANAAYAQNTYKDPYSLGMGGNYNLG